MFALKIATTVSIVILMLIFLCGIYGEKEKDSIIMLGFMEIVYVLSLICMWV